ncbi:MAG: DUF3365 domain-containing protein [Candidatus Scalindua sp. AMX11]|nr:MAG: DUF3365 domain-containing protein [Candidatus Scalindua sp.]NOG82863.1 DUF3365 domain-containing protein [Planctomycetota bacterium]RZV86208.1 MAG: DUF3365 domain-containing protein [Candidatus Scalindua sp. SCAELEC01]TDE65829.1 MAG: DUF3365 domain-containing protein [Candidatus Scalindua sp. AMX11]GJQ58335.1 MAG: hypothetical protein SCALA701_11360 [Candidatus Scalindua sp.]
MYYINKITFSMFITITLLWSITLTRIYAESRECDHTKCVKTLADTTIDMLIATRSVVAKNQDLINVDPVSGNYYFKGFVPAMVGSEVANDFSLMTGHKLKQTSLKLRNPNNAPDEWEEKVLRSFEASGYPKGAGFGEALVTGDNKIYRYMKPIYVEKACLECHSTKKNLRPEIRKFLEERYPYDHAFGYKEGDVRGGISITLPFGN